MNKTSLLSLSVIAITLLIAFSYLSMGNNASQYEDSDSLGGDFSLPIENGSFNLTDYRGKIIVLYFGFASCPDVCPTALAFTGNILKTLPTAVIDNIQPVFISVDPARDSLENLTVYGHYFHPKMIAGTDSQAAIDILVRQYGAFYSIKPQQDSAIGYSVDHSSQLYIIDSQGLLIETIAHADIQTKLQPTLLTLTKDL